MRAARLIRRLLAVLFAAAAALAAIGFYQRYWRWRDCFNDEGRCFDPQTQDVLLEQAGIGWGSLSVVCAMVACALLFRDARN